MSDADSFIDEVTEEVRRDRMYLLLRRWGWVGVVVVIAVVGGAAWNEYRKAQETATAQQLGDALIAALDPDAPADRAAALAQVQPDTPGGAAVRDLLTAAAQAQSGEQEAAAETLAGVSTQGELPEIYRQIATFKALLMQAETLPVADRRQQFEALAQPGAPLRLLAEEQLALIEIEQDAPDAAIDRLQGILQDAEASVDLQQRASQLIVALGGTPEPAPGQQG
ncbi:tetratricopeptide repeat protein [Lutimaribacter marinistellae]|uniref:Tetratricopeptide repeat protein n=1 Tax=Lutimaribacter marinistellae TaxID=1820329 RepID=A0ABV7TN95_9RHOB